MVTVNEDGVLNKDVVEMSGHGQLVFSPMTNLRWAVCHVLPTGFFTIECVIKVEGGHRKISLTNHRTIAVIEADHMRATLPLQLTSSVNWQLIPIDLVELTMVVFGLEYVRLDQLRIRNCCAVRKVYCCDQIYADAELPEYLRALG